MSPSGFAEASEGLIHCPHEETEVHVGLRVFYEDSCLNAIG